MQNKNIRKNAFSLIELAIVIVVIGLLITGVMGGASLIKSATLRAIIAESRNYKVATSSFYTIKNYFPGDYDGSIGSVVSVGNGNDIIDTDVITTTNTANTPVSESIYEPLLAIAHLHSEGSLDDSLFTTSYNITDFTTVPESTTSGVHFPKGKLDKSSWVLMNHGDGNKAILSRGVTTSYAPKAILSKKDAQNIDSKSDDGDLSTGSVIGIGSGNDSSNTSSCYTANTSSDIAVCALGFDIELF